MFSVDRHLDSYSYQDFKNRRKWLFRKYKGNDSSGRLRITDDTAKLQRYNMWGYLIPKYDRQPIDNEYQYYRGFGQGRPSL